MKKETIYAILLGITFGVVLSFVMIAKTKDNQLGKVKPLTSEKKTTTIVPDSTGQILTFKIDEPQDKLIVNTNTVTIKGSAEKDSTIIIQSPIKDLVYKNEKENFSFNFPLAIGENVIGITVYPKSTQGRPQGKELRVYYLDEQ